LLSSSNEVDAFIANVSCDQDKLRRTSNIISYAVSQTSIDAYLGFVDNGLLSGTPAVKKTLSL